MVPPMFKKRERKSQLRKKRPRTEEPEEEAEGGAGPEDTGELLASMRELQKQRARSSGLDPQKAEEKERQAERKRQAKVDQTAQAAKSTGGLLSALFEQQQERSLVDKQMDDFIERNMAIRRGEDPDAKDVVVKTREDLLYQTPAELIPATSEVRESELSGVSDIKEVELDIVTKLKVRSCAGSWEFRSLLAVVLAGQWVWGRGGR